MIPTAIHPEDFCEMCGQRNLRNWFVDSIMWNRVVGYDWSILCPICFVILANKKGINPTAWGLVAPPQHDEKPIRKLSNALEDAIHCFDEHLDKIVTDERVEAWKAVLKQYGSAEQGQRT